jgi:hypothetical protein
MIDQILNDQNLNLNYSLTHINFKLYTSENLICLFYSY